MTTVDDMAKFAIKRLEEDAGGHCNHDPALKEMGLLGHVMNVFGQSLAKDQPIAGALIAAFGEQFLRILCQTWDHHPAYREEWKAVPSEDALADLDF